MIQIGLKSVELNISHPCLFAVMFMNYHCLVELYTSWCMKTKCILYCMYEEQSLVIRNEHPNSYVVTTQSHLIDHQPLDNLTVISENNQIMYVSPRHVLCK